MYAARLPRVCLAGLSAAVFLVACDDGSASAGGGVGATGGAAGDGGSAVDGGGASASSGSGDAGDARVGTSGGTGGAADAGQGNADGGTGAEDSGPTPDAGSDDAGSDDAGTDDAGMNGDADAGQTQPVEPASLTCEELQGEVTATLADIASCSSGDTCKQSFLGTGCTDSPLPVCGLPHVEGADLTRLTAVSTAYKDRPCQQGPVACASCALPTSIECIEGACVATY